MKVLITGGKSMMGRAIARQLGDGVEYHLVSHENVDLLSESETCQLFSIYKPTHVIHCAGYNGNIQFNNKYPADIFGRTVQMAMNVLEKSVKYGVQKVVTPISSCCYPEELCGEPFKEEDLWKGEPNADVEAHGFAKRFIVEYSRMLHKQYGLNSVGIIFNTVYGPYDSFDVNKTKVVGGLIAKIYKAHKEGLPEVVLWGTGRPKREIVYCDDAAKDVVWVLNNYDNPRYPINSRYGFEVTIERLATAIAILIGYKGNIVFDTSMPDGQMRKVLDKSNIHSRLLKEEWSFGDNVVFGLDKTIRWYIQNYGN